MIALDASVVVERIVPNKSYATRRHQGWKI